MSKRLSKNVINLIEKSKDSALLAVDIYNKPKTSFRSGGFVVLMCIAWTSLLHSIFEKRAVKYFYKDKKHARNYLKVDGDYKAWDLMESANQFFEDRNNPVYKNIVFFAKLRNKIEHRFMPSIDPIIVGECQSSIFNFEELLVQEFGETHSIVDTLFIPLQLTAHKKNLPSSKDERRVVDFIKTFRGSLTEDVSNSQKYSFKAFFVPKLGNLRSSSDIAIEFVKFDPNNPDELKQYEKMIVGIKEKTVEVANLGKYKPSAIFEILKSDKRLNDLSLRIFESKGMFMTWHTRMWKKYRVRPSSKERDSRKCVIRYCQYDEAHKDYIYTNEWIEFLVKNEILTTKSAT